MDRKTLILFGGAITLLVIAVILAVNLRGSREESGRVNVNVPYEGYITSSSGGGSQIDNQSVSHPTSKIIGAITVTQLDNNHYLLENKNDGYQIMVTSDWMMSEENIKNNIFKLYYSSAENLKIGTELMNVAILSVEVLDNSKQYSFDEWFKNLDAFTSKSIGMKSSYEEIMINGQMSFRGSSKSDEFNDYGELILREDSSIINYLFLRGLKVYRIKCASSGSDYKSLIQVCENQVKSFLIE